MKRIFVFFFKQKTAYEMRISDWSSDVCSSDLHREVDVARQRREVACLDGYRLRQGAVAMPVGEAEHSLSYRQSRRAVAESGDHSGQLVAGDRRCSVTAEAIGPGRGPRHLSRDESRRMNLNDDVVYRCLRLGPLHQRHPGRSRSLVRHHDRLHRNCLLGHMLLSGSYRSAGLPFPIRRKHTFHNGGDTAATVLTAIRTSRRGTTFSNSRSEEHTSELQSLMRNSYAVFCLKKKKTINRHTK